MPRWRRSSAKYVSSTSGPTSRSASGWWPKTPGYLADIWEATRHAFTDNNLTRKLKEALAFAVSVTSRSSFGTGFHLGEMRRLGVSEAGIREVLGVTQMFSSYTKIADALQLEPDMANIAPLDPTPAPGKV